MLLFSAQRSDKFSGRLSVVLAEVAIGGGFRTEAGIEKQVALALQRVTPEFLGYISNTKAVHVVEEGGIGVLTEAAQHVVLVRTQQLAQRVER